MVSPTQKTEAKRSRKNAAQGKQRKKALAQRGSTPKFPIHPEGKAKSAAKPTSKAKPKPKAKAAEKS